MNNSEVKHEAPGEDNDRSAIETVVETVAKKVGSAIGTITVKIIDTRADKAIKQDTKTKRSSHRAKGVSDGQAAKRLTAKKKKKAAHQRKIRGSSTNG